MNVPKLRFKDFNDDWTFQKLINLTEILRCGIASTPVYVDDGIPFLSAQNVSSDGQLLLNKYNHISEDFYQKISKNHELKDGDILYSRVGASFGNAAIFNLSGQYGVYVSLTHIRTNSSLNNHYLKYYLNSIKGKKQAENGVVQGGGVPNLNVKVVEKFSIPISSIREQTKIANFLTAVDEKISQLTKKHELLTRYKKGVMQKIFSQELRFKDDDGSDFAEWKEFKLHALVEKIGSGGTPKSSIAEYYDGDIPWVSIADMTSDGKYITKTKKRISALGLKNSSAKLLPEGTLLFAMYASIGELAIAKIPVTTSQAILGIITKKNLLLTDYLYFWLLSLKEKITLMGQQGAQANLNLEIVKNFLIGLPSLKEQNKIVEFLGAIDEKISQSQTQLELVKQYKQGLLQQMFV